MANISLPITMSASEVLLSDGRTIEDALHDLPSGPSACESISIKTFGAAGDGVADDSEAIRLAVQSGRRVVFPAGTYLVKKACLFSNLHNFALIGEGVGVTSIKCDPSAVFTNGIAFSGCSHFEVSGITFDQNNNPSFTAALPFLFAVGCTDFRIAGNEVIHYTYIGIGADSCKRFWVQNNGIERDAAINSTNYAINVTSSAFASEHAFITHNRCKNSGSIFKGRNITVAENIFADYKYGAGITTVGDGTATYGQYIVTGNSCTGGTGIDVDGVYVAGMEISGAYCVISNNICNGNFGAGIASLAWRATISGNTCLGNGVGGGGAQYQSGILMAHVSGATSASHCLVSGNHCSDYGASTQLYGYYESSASLIGNTVSGNKFSGNIAGNEFLQGTNGYYETTEWKAYTPTISSGTGTITAVGAVTGRYKRKGKMVFVRVRAAITTNGTGGSVINVSLPPQLGIVTGGNSFGTGREDGVTGKQLLVKFNNGTTNAIVANYDQSYPGSNGAVLDFSGWYEVS